MTSLFETVTYPGVYRAICLSADTTSIKAKVPQIFADVTVTIFEAAGGRPAAGDSGWVAFESGRAERPVWMGTESKGGDGGGGGPSNAEVWVLPSTPPDETAADGRTLIWVDTDATSTPFRPVSFVFDQSTPSATWVIVHNLGFYPNVYVQDSAGSDVIGDLVYDSTNQVTVYFGAAFSGRAYLS